MAAPNNAGKVLSFHLDIIYIDEASKYHIQHILSELARNDSGILSWHIFIPGYTPENAIILPNQPTLLKVVYTHSVAMSGPTSNLGHDIRGSAQEVMQTRHSIEKLLNALMLRSIISQYKYEPGELSGYVINYWRPSGSPPVNPSMSTRIPKESKTAGEGKEGGDTGVENGAKPWYLKTQDDEEEKVDE